jgi:hypothetical protein
MKDGSDRAALAPARFIGAPTMPIRRYLRANAAFGPEAIKAMSEALERACAGLHVNGQVRDREAIAARIIDLAHNGVLDAKVLSDRVVAETKALHAL